MAQRWCLRKMVSMVGQIVEEDSPRLPHDDLSQVGEELQVIAKEARTRYWSSAVLEAVRKKPGL